MLEWYSQRIASWELELASRDRNRKVHPFEWGLDWLAPQSAPRDPARHLGELVELAVADSEAYFSYIPPADFACRDGHLTFRSPVISPFPENNTVHADYFPSSTPGERAVVVLPQWNADRDGHVGLCRLLNRFGISALRMNKAYHDRRMPTGFERADYHVSSNLGRTIHATRQSVIDARCCVDWLTLQGHRRVGIVGTSLGSCVAFITAAHEPRLRAGVFNHVSNHFADVVWTGLATRHVRDGLDGRVTREQLRRFWSVISPATYIGKFDGRGFRSLLIWAKYDSVFLPEFSREFVESFPATKVRCLPCGHYTVGEFPFNWIDGLSIGRFLSQNL